jgi:hypothetical protein
MYSRGEGSRSSLASQVLEEQQESLDVTPQL